MISKVIDASKNLINGSHAATTNDSSMSQVINLSDNHSFNLLTHLPIYLKIRFMPLQSNSKSL
jgi:hypothetical protein